MTYLEILKKFDKAIVTESQKLQDIYDNLVKDGHASNQFCNEEEKDDTKKPEEGAVENPECNGESEKDDTRKQACEFTEADEDVTETAQTTPAQTTPAQKKEGSSGGMVSKEDFFRTDDDTDDDTGDSAGTTDDSQDTEPDEANESSAEQRAALSASDLFEDEKKPDESEDTSSADDNKDTPVDEPENPKGDSNKKNTPPETEPKTKPETKPEDDAEGPEDDAEDEKPTGECENQKRKSAQDWLNEKQDDTEAEGAKCPECGNSPCTCDEEEKDPETEQLQESIKNISAFVKANKKLFVG